jgi:hypothetical protein
MKIIIAKRATSFLPPPPSCTNEWICDWESHPSLIAGVEALNAYQTWVSGVVLPIAFQWIEEHYNEIYPGIPEELWDDVGVVISAAFQLVRQSQAYKDGLDELEKIEKERKDGMLKTDALNPIWTKITKEVRKATKEAYQAEKQYLDDTI